MRISIFYRNVFEPGGAPVGIRHLANRLAKRHDVALWGHATDDEWPLLDGVQQRSYVGRSELTRRLPGWIATDAPEILLVIGFFLPDNIPVVRAARRAGVPTVLHPMAQVWDSALKGKIFTHGCDVRALEKKRINRDGLVARVSNWLNPAAKRAFMHSVGRAMGLGTDAVAVLSDDERTQFQSYFPRPDRDFVTMEWGVDELETMPDDSAHFFRDTLGVSTDRPNLIVWSRLDWHYKGLDRLLNGVAEVKRRQSEVPFRLYLCGPDYREGSVLARQFIAQHGLQDDVFVFLPGDYTPGSKTPLRDADASVLLSRWDGSPRALRESLLFGT
ncbi:MAG: glycosyltransferase, partial [Bacteroidota bacterium]